jgi:hypothetical protein
MWRLAGESGARDVVLHNIDAVGEHIEVSRRRRPLRQELWGDLSNLLAQWCRQLCVPKTLSGDDSDLTRKIHFWGYMGLQARER